MMNIESITQTITMETFEPVARIVITCSLENSIDFKAEETSQDEIDRYIGEQIRLAIEQYRKEEENEY